MKIYVGNLSRSTTDAQLTELAARYGIPESCYIVRTFAENSSRGFGFVEYAEPAQAHAAIAGLRGREFEGRILEAREAKVAKPCATSAVLHPR